jgi:hypothetical protein
MRTAGGGKDRNKVRQTFENLAGCCNWLNIEKESVAMGCDD